MSKPTIKVIKRKTEAELANDASTPVIIPVKTDIETDRDITKAVEGWIANRDKNNDAEKLFSAKRLVAWDES